MQRRESKPEIAVPKLVYVYDGSVRDPRVGWIVRLSIAGVDIESHGGPPLGADVAIWTELVEGEGMLQFRGRVQWVTSSRFGVQFGLLGAQEAHAVVRAASASRPAGGESADPEAALTMRVPEC
jgi:hypothetical protein